MEKQCIVKSGDQRSFAYQVKTDPERVKQINEARREQMNNLHSHKQALLVVLEARAKNVLNAAGIPGIAYVGYLNFARELWKKSQKMSAQSFWLEVRASKAKWVERKLDGDLLETLAHELFCQTGPV
jgi:hypothetical protein